MTNIIGRHIFPSLSFKHENQIEKSENAHLNRDICTNVAELGIDVKHSPLYEPEEQFL